MHRFPPFTEHYELRQMLKLPVTPLNEICSLFLSHAKPLLTHEDYAQLVKWVKEFERGLGRELYFRLVSLRNMCKSSWYESYADSAYLEYRAPVMINVNPAFVMKEDSRFNGSRPLDQIARAALLLQATAHFVSLWRSCKMQPDMLPLDGQKAPLCMHQYNVLFGGMRIPREGRDINIQNIHSRHAVIMANGRYYAMNLLDDHDAVIMAPALFRSLRAILEHSRFSEGTASEMYESHGVSVLTSQHRDVWCRQYGELQSLNPKTIESINASLIMMVLDDASPADLNGANMAILHNHGLDRWFDKPIELIVFRNAIAGINMEHSTYDGQVLSRFISEVVEEAERLDDVLDDNLPSCTDLLAAGVTPLTWNISPSLKLDIRSSEVAAAAFSDSLHGYMLSIDTVSKAIIAGRLKRSPDAFFQLALHTACGRLFNAPKMTYESCSTRHFYHARTECIRSLTNEVVHFIRVAKRSHSTAEEQIQAADAALQAHVNLAKRCQRGQGFDRAMAVLFKLGKSVLGSGDGDVMASSTGRRSNLIQDISKLPSWRNMRSDFLSTSNSGNPNVASFTFGPTSDDGFGIGYMIHQGRVLASITSFEHDPSVMAASLAMTLNDFRALYEGGKPLRIGGSSPYAPRSMI